MTERPARPWRMLIPLAVVLALFALWSGYWVFALAAAKSYAASYREDFARRGLSLECDRESWGGYPFRFEFACANPRLRLRHRTIASGALTAVAQAYNPTLAIVLVDGPTILQDGTAAAVPVDHGRAIASLRVAGKNLPRISVEIPAVAVAGWFRARTAWLHLKPGSEGAIDIAVAAEAAAYTPDERPPLAIDRADIVAILDAAAQTLTITAAQFRHGDIALDASGTAELDAGRRVAGKIDFKTNDLPALLAAVEPHLRLSDTAKATLRAALALLGKNARASLTAKDGALFLGPVKVGGLRPLY